MALVNNDFNYEYVKLKAGRSQKETEDAFKTDEFISFEN